ncbi:hypothetical protein EDD16DRAFT_1517329 [Pisolithus croceorrhizus]|nr:hypothetical protein EV401DRAFT_1887532 [Pisolithus croceorrhizus]KAI6125103.1 hypothetical protein EDD16DRAFT_1517329 [Pisolithus croceorrhizus]
MSLQANLWVLGGSASKYGCSGGASNPFGCVNVSFEEEADYLGTFSSPRSASFHTPLVFQKGSDANGGGETSSYLHPQSTFAACEAPACHRKLADLCDTPVPHEPRTDFEDCRCAPSCLTGTSDDEVQKQGVILIITRYGEMGDGNEVLSARDLLRALRTEWRNKIDSHRRFIDALRPIISTQYHRLSLVVKVEEKEEYKLTSHTSTYPSRSLHQLRASGNYTASNV